MRTGTVLSAVFFCTLLTGTGCQNNGAARFHSPKQNPTTLAKRGDPSRDDVERAAAWILIDGKEGVYKEDDRTGFPRMEWIIEEPVSPTPTLRLEIYKPLLGKKVNANFALQTIAAEDGLQIYYGLAGQKDVFQAGKAYPLTDPGSALVIRRASDKAVVDHIEPLPPGRYAIAATVKSPKTDKDVIAATYFTVGKPDEGREN